MVARILGSAQETEKIVRQGWTVMMVGAGGLTRFIFRFLERTLFKRYNVERDTPSVRQMSATLPSRSAIRRHRRRPASCQAAHSLPARSASCPSTG